MYKIAIPIAVLFFLVGCHKSDGSSDNQDKSPIASLPNSETSNNPPQVLAEKEKEPLDKQSFCRLKAIASISLEVLVQIEKRSYRTGIMSGYYNEELSKCHENNYTCIFDRLGEITSNSLYRQEVIAYNHSPSANYSHEKFKSCGEKSLGCKTMILGQMNSTILAEIELELNRYSTIAEPLYKAIDECNYDVACLLKTNGKIATTMLQMQMQKYSGHSDVEIPQINKYNLCESVKND